MSSATRARRRETLRARLTLWYVAALTLTLSAFAALLLGALSRTLYQHHDQELLAAGRRVADRLATVPLREDAIARALHDLDPAPPLLMVRNSAGDLVYRSPVLQVVEPSIGRHEALVHAVANAPSAPEFFTVTLERSGLVRFMCTRIGGSPAAYIQVGNPLGNVHATLHAVAVASVVLGPLVILLTSVGGWLIAGRALAPIESMDRTLRAIEATDLSQRVEVHAADRELHGLIGTVNGLLTRLEHAFEDLRHFAADASHQLQTPLSIMKNAIADTRQAPLEELPALLDDLDQEVDDMSAVVADLQTLSLADVDIRGTARTDVDLSALCLDAVEIVAALGEPAAVGVRGEISEGVRVTGDPVKLKQLVLNLGDNAVKYTRAGGQVRVQLWQEDGSAVLQVADSGIGIGVDQVLRIFDRFYRAPTAPHHGTGSGLGLAIAKRIVEVHHGTIDVSSELGRGTQFTVRLPS